MVYHFHRAPFLLFFSPPIFLTRAQTAEKSSRGRITRATYTVESIENACPGQDSHGGTRCSTPQKLTYRVPRSNNEPASPSSSKPAPRKLCNPNVSRFPRVDLPPQLAAVQRRPSIIPTLFSRPCSRARIRSRKRDRNWPLSHAAIMPS